MYTYNTLKCIYGRDPQSTKYNKCATRLYIIEKTTCCIVVERIYIYILYRYRNSNTLYRLWSYLLQAARRIYMLMGRGLLFGRYGKCQEMVRATYIVLR